MTKYAVNLACVRAFMCAPARSCARAYAFRDLSSLNDAIGLVSAES